MQMTGRDTLRPLFGRKFMHTSLTWREARLFDMRTRLGPQYSTARFLQLESPSRYCMIQNSVSQVGTYVPHVEHGEILMGHETCHRIHTFKRAPRRSRRATNNLTEN